MIAASAAVVLALCAGCSHGATPAAPAATTGAGDLGSQLDQLQSTLDSVSAQVGADSAP